MGNRERNFIIGLANPEVNPQSSLPLSGFTLPAPPAKKPRAHLAPAGAADGLHLDRSPKIYPPLRALSLFVPLARGYTLSRAKRAQAIVRASWSLAAALQVLLSLRHRPGHRKGSPTGESTLDTSRAQASSNSIRCRSHETKQNRGLEAPDLPSRAAG